MFFNSFVESSRVATKYLEKLRLEFILEEEYLNSFRRVHLQHQEHSPIFDIARIFNACDNLKVSGASPVSLLVSVGFAVIILTRLSGVHGGVQRQPADEPLRWLRRQRTCRWRRRARSACDPAATDSGIGLAQPLLSGSRPTRTNRQEQRRRRRHDQLLQAEAVPLQQLPRPKARPLSRTTSAAKHGTLSFLLVFT